MLASRRRYREETGTPIAAALHIGSILSFAQLWAYNQRGLGM